jgi:hypothetical protein
MLSAQIVQSGIAIQIHDALSTIIILLCILWQDNSIFNDIIYIMFCQVFVTQVQQVSATPMARQFYCHKKAPVLA